MLTFMAFLSLKEQKHIEYDSQSQLPVFSHYKKISYSYNLYVTSGNVSLLVIYLKPHTEKNLNTAVKKSVNKAI